MQKVQITISNRLVLVDEDQVKMLLTKDAAVKEAVVIQEKMKLGDAKYNYEIQPTLMKLMGTIIRLNKKIRRNVQFV